MHEIVTVKPPAVLMFGEIQLIKGARLLLRFERIQQRHYGMKLLAYTLMNLREFCGT